MTKKEKKRSGSLADAWHSPGFWTEVAIGEFVRGLRQVMGSMKQRDLAARLEVSESAVSQILSGAEENYSIERMNRIAGALDAAVHVCVTKRDSVVKWTVVPTGPLGEIVASPTGNQQVAELLEIIGDAPVPDPNRTHTPDLNPSWLNVALQ